MRAVCESHPDVDELDLPDIEVIIVANEESKDVTVKICDQGGGIPKEQVDKIWYYSFTTVKKNAGNLTSSINSALATPGGGAPMAGFGYGLPLSRLHARYFGGDLEVVSIHGYGSDAFLYLPYLNPQEQSQRLA